MENNIILSLEHIMKIYMNGTVANEDVSFSLRRGEIHALLGENGAGKSTLMKVLYGIESPTEGKIILKGQEAVMKSSKDAISMGIGMVHQHFMLVPSLTVAENIVLGAVPKKWGVFIDKKRAIKDAEKIASTYRFEIDVNEKVGNLSVGLKQKVEILKALYRGAEILIMDEPTAVLTPQETEELFVQLQKLKESGRTIIFISHKLDEIKQICDRATIMRRGRSMGTYEVSGISVEEMSRLMVGSEVRAKLKKEYISGEVKVRVKDLQAYDIQGVHKVKGISFKIKSGEILGIAGVEGNGQAELVEIITGLCKNYTGTVEICGENTELLSIKQIRGLHLSHIPEDRMQSGCAPSLSILDNLFSTQYDDEKYAGKCMLDRKKLESQAEDLRKEYFIKCESCRQNVGMLSGGNIQKVIVARELSTEPMIIIANQPTRGVDIGASQFIRERLIDYRNKGAAILLVSADLSELLSLSDRIAVMYKGKIAGMFSETEKPNEELIGQYMLGILNQEETGGVEP